MKKVIGSVLIIVLLIGAFFIGRYYGSAESTASSAPATIPEESVTQKLRLSFVHNIESHGYIHLEQGNYEGVGYTAIEDVSIEIDGESIALEDALTEGKISVDEIITWARQDAAMGFCVEVAKSKNGLTELFYHYGNFSLCYMYDVYETPDRGQHLITNFDIYSNGADSGVFFPIDEETGEPIDYENWGLNFEVLKADHSSITIKCTHSGGQQIGTFTVEYSMLYKIDPDTQHFQLVQPLTEGSALIAGCALTMEGETELVAEFTQLYGQLEAGEYVLTLWIMDQYGEEDVHPLMRNYHDLQWYEIAFTIENA